MKKHTIPTVGMSVKIAPCAWLRMYDLNTAEIRSDDLGYITEIVYNGQNPGCATFNSPRTKYTVYFPATFFKAEMKVVCNYEDLIFDDVLSHLSADFDGDCVTGLTGVIPTCAMTWYESPKIDCCCGDVRTPVSGKVCTPMPASVLNDIFKDFTKDLDRANGYLKEAAENLKRATVHSMYPRIETKYFGHTTSLCTIDETPFDQFAKYAKRDVEMTEQLYLYGIMQQPCDGFKINVTMPPRFGKKLNIEELEKRMLNIGFGLHTVDPLIKTVKTSEKEKKTMDFRVKKIMHNGPATIVFWKDNTKTVVRLKEGDRYDPYAAFTAAVAKRLYGKTMKISEIVDRYSKDLKNIDIPETPPRDLTVEELKAAAEKLGYRVSKKPKK